jgi:mono/diheme cytochrome c family protein
LDVLEEAFSEGIYTGHPDMPVFKLTKAQIDDVLAYLESLQAAHDAWHAEREVDLSDIPTLEVARV